MKRILLLFLKGLGVFTALLLLLFLLAPRLINTEAIKLKIEADLSRRINGTVRFEKFDFRILPLPSATLNRITFIIPGKTGGTIQRLRAYPRLIALLTEGLPISSVRIESPDIWSRPDVTPRRQTMTPDLKEKLAPFLTALAIYAPELAGNIEDGTFSFIRDTGPAFVLREVQAHIVSSPGKMYMEIQSRNDDWGTISVKGNFFFSGNILKIADLSGVIGNSSVSGLAARLDLTEAAFLEIFSGTSELALHEAHSILSSISINGIRTIKKITGSLTISSMTFAGRIRDPGTWKMAFTGRVKDLVLDSAALKAPFALSRGTFSLDEKKIAFENAHATFLDATLSGSGSLRNRNILRGIRAADLSLSGILGARTLRRLSPLIKLPKQIREDISLSLSDTRVSWKKNGTISFSGNIRIEHGPALLLSLYRTPRELVVRRLTIRDQKSSATLSLTRRKDFLESEFTGTLVQSTVNSILSRPIAGEGILKGDFHVRIPLNEMGRATARGAIQGFNFVIPWGLDPPVRLKTIDLKATGKSLVINSSVVTWKEMDFSIQGNLAMKTSGLVANLDVSADGMNINAISESLIRRRQEQGPLKMPVSGTIRLLSKYVEWGRFTFSPVRAHILFDQDGIRSTITEAMLCGIVFSGNFAVNPDGFGFYLTPVAAGQQLEPEVGCLFGTELKVTGTFYLDGQVTMKGRGKELLPSLDGVLNLVSKDGQIKRYPLLARIFSVLSVLEVIRGKLPDLGQRAFDYETMTITGVLNNGKIELQQVLIEGSSIDIVAEGSIDLVRKKIDLVVLVAPFSTLNWFLRHIPLLGNILGGTIVSIPIEVSGDLNNPKVILLSPEAVGSRILQLLKNIIQLPVEIFRK